MRIFNSITEGNQFDEKLFISHPLADDLDRSLKSIRRVIHQRKKELQIEKVIDKTKKKWTVEEDKAIEAAITTYGPKIKKIIKDNVLHAALADKSVKEIEKRIAKFDIEDLRKCRGGTKMSPSKPTTTLSVHA
ncbi:uncharacterized protein LOC123907215 [Trifolium pratense]|uniref:uncharacterized protein LOC123907215 n=1 Tax=Trifolium pratense TaxID=57577 RepID=UPI001E68FF8E|nr:uncharacterized protein LOC123907215 [Trifolium pratense]